ncbi:MAG: flagellar hook-associated protein FlgK [Alphaproteobacteria bacterium]
MSITLALQTALTGIQSSQLALQVNANNIANANTEGFSRKQVELSPRRLDGLGAGVDTVDITRTVNQFLINQVRDQGGKLAAISAREQFLTQIQGFLGTPDSNDTFASGLTRMSNNFESLALAPESDAARFTAVNEARRLMSQFTQLATGIQTLRAEADQSITAAVNTVNQQLEFVDNLNAKIAQAVATSEPDGELRDQRDVAIGKIAELLDIRTFEGGNGKVSIFTGGGRTILSEGTLFTLTHTSAAQTDAGTAFVQPGDANYPGGIDGIYVGAPDRVTGANDITTQITQGEIKGLIDIRDNILPNLQKELDRLTSVLAAQINSIHNQGTAFPPPATLTGTHTMAATDAFSGTGTVRIAVLDQATGDIVEFTDINLAGLGATATVGDVVNAINAGLTGTPASINASGQFVIQAQAANQGISIGASTGEVTVAGSLTRNFSHFFGLNDFLTTGANGTDYDSYATARQASSTAALGLAGTLTFRFDGTAGTAVNYAAGESLEDIAATINGTAALTAAGITATVTDDSGERRLTITDAGGDNFIIGDSGTLLTTLNVIPDDTGTAAAIAVNSAVASNPDLLSRGQLDLTAAVGDTGTSVGDGAIANALAGLFGTGINFPGSGGISTGTTTIISFAAKIVDLQSSLASDARSDQQFNEVFLETLIFRQTNDAGVNVDEELAELVILQNAFSASARVLTAASEMLDALIASVR